MKLLGWIHRKLRPNNGDAGSACLFCVSGLDSPDDGRHKLAPSILRRDLARAENEPPASTAFLSFDGLLNIGTFGLPVTTTNVVDEIAETENDEVISISAELEKVFCEETEKELDSVRLSHAGAGGKGSEVLPLQHFLLGSSVEVAETVSAEDHRRDRRVSLGELLMKSRAAEEGGGGKREEPLLEDREMKRMLAAGETNVGSVGMDRVLDSCGSVGKGAGGSGATGIRRASEIKILRMFHRKIHPENAVASKKIRKSSKYENSKDKCGKNKRESRNYSGRQVLPKKIGDAERGFSDFQEAKAFLSNRSKDNRGHWIKTDADYLVLEL